MTELAAINKLGNIRRSIKKYFTDHLTILDNINVYYDIAVTPLPNDSDVDEWVVIHFGEHMPASVSSLTLSLFLLTRRDIEGDDLADLYDKVQAYVHPGQIDLYDVEWNKIGGAKVYPKPNQGYTYTWDKTKIQKTFIELKWGANW